jgi:hypothetical protein
MGVVRSPLLVLGSGHRSGSTLVQRVLSSHPEVLIWGEHGGWLGLLLEAGEALLSWSDEYGQDAREEFAHDGYQSWMANLTPERDHVGAALRDFVQSLYGDPAAELGRPVWGFKEVRYSIEDARRLHRLFPGLAVVLVVRDPRDVLRSLDEWERLSGGQWTRPRTEGAIEVWRLVAEDFLAGETSPPVLGLRYEDMIRDPEGTCAALGAHTGLDPAGFDVGVFAKRVHIGAGLAGLPRDLRDWHDLPEDLRALLDERTRRLARACGYELS